MSNYNQTQAYPPQVSVNPVEPQMAPPPPAGYPVKDNDQGEATVPVSAQSKGDGFWKGCCAAMCCCCALDICF